MSASIVFARGVLLPETPERVDPLFQQLAIHALSSSHSESMSLWQEQSNPERMVLIASAKGLEPSQEAWGHFAQILGGDALIEALGSMDSHVTVALQQHGQEPHRCEIGDFVSLSVRHAVPGMSDELVQEMDAILESLQYLPGYLGSILSQSVSTPEEILGAVFWSNREGYDESQPHRGLYEIRLYRRIL